MGNTLLIGGLVAAVGLAIAGYGVYRVYGQGVGTDPLLNLIKIGRIDVNERATKIWDFDVDYRNNSDVQQSFAGIIQVSDPNDVTIDLQTRNMSLFPGETKKFGGQFSIPTAQREIGKNKVEFFAWRSADDPVAIARNKHIFV